MNDEQTARNADATAAAIRTVKTAAEGDAEDEAIRYAVERRSVNESVAATLVVSALRRVLGRYVANATAPVAELRRVGALYVAEGPGRPSGLERAARALEVALSAESGQPEDLAERLLSRSREAQGELRELIGRLASGACP